MKKVALARVLLARLFGGSLSKGPPFGLLSFEVMRDKKRGHEVFLLQRKKILGPAKILKKVLHKF